MLEISWKCWFIIDEMLMPEKYQIHKLFSLISPSSWYKMRRGPWTLIVLTRAAAEVLAITGAANIGPLELLNPTQKINNNLPLIKFMTL